jgi:hypothetical protein
MTKPSPRYHQQNGHILTPRAWRCTTSPITYPSSSCVGGLKLWCPGATNRSYVPVRRGDIIGKVTLVSERWSSEVPDTLECLRIIDHGSLHLQQMDLVVARERPSPPDSTPGLQITSSKTNRWQMNTILTIPAHPIHNMQQIHWQSTKSPTHVDALVRKEI